LLFIDKDKNLSFSFTLHLKNLPAIDEVKIKGNMEFLRGFKELELFGHFGFATNLVPSNKLQIVAHRNKPRLEVL